MALWWLFEGRFYLFVISRKHTLKARAIGGKWQRHPMRYSLRGSCLFNRLGMAVRETRLVLSLILQIKKPGNSGLFVDE
jgi:hypothetical protein